MANIYYFLAILVVMMAIWSIYTYIKKLPQTPTEMRKTTIIINRHSFEVEIAENDANRQKGLMERAKLEKNQGMLFIFEKNGIYPFWMKNTLIPLDIIWISADKKITYIHKNAVPCQNTVVALCKTIIPTNTAKYVLEINGGLSEELQIKTGDEVSFEL